MAAQVRRLTLEEEYTARCPTSAELYRRAVNVFPSGVTHDSRYVQPHPVYISRGHGSRAWDVDGNEYVDYWSGHGALLLGHCHPAIMAAVSAQLQKGTHYGGSTELEVRWGELVQQIVPSAERVKFFSSGTEATMMAMRLARAYTGKSKIVKIQGHFHGWHDYATVAMQPPWEVPISAGVPQETASTVLHVPFKDIEALRQLLAARDDIAGVIMLCNGAGTEYLRQVRDLTRQHGVVLIFDEDDEQNRFSYRMTWLGEHEQESDMAFYATPPEDHVVGPGICRCEYGGFLMIHPPRRLFDVWEDPDYRSFRRKSEVLLAAGIDYSLERQVIYVAPRPPRSYMRTLAERMLRQIVYLPLGSLSPSRLARIRVFHILSGYDKREIAKDYIW